MLPTPKDLPDLAKTCVAQELRDAYGNAILSLQHVRKHWAGREVNESSCTLLDKWIAGAKQKAADSRLIEEAINAGAISAWKELEVGSSAYETWQRWVESCTPPVDEEYAAGVEALNAQAMQEEWDVSGLTDSIDSEYHDFPQATS